MNWGQSNYTAVFGGPSSGTVSMYGGEAMYLGAVVFNTPGYVIGSNQLKFTYTSTASITMNCNYATIKSQIYTTTNNQWFDLYAYTSGTLNANWGGLVNGNATGGTLNYLCPLGPQNLTLFAYNNTERQWHLPPGRSLRRHADGGRPIYLHECPRYYRAERAVGHQCQHHRYAEWQQRPDSYRRDPGGRNRRHL